MIENIAVLALIWISISAVYFFKNKKPITEDKYVWVGMGKDPFRK